MGRYSAGMQWENLNRKRQEAENRELEAQKAAANQAVRDQIGGLPSLESLNATLPVRERPPFQNSISRSHRREENVAELEAQEDPPPQYWQQAPLTPPASAGDATEADSSGHIMHLEKELIHKESQIQRLESEVEAEREKRRRLQAERHEAVDAQRRAESGLRKLKNDVANLDQLLDGSVQRQKDLESELDISRQEIRELKRELHEERCSYESDVRARESREAQIRRQFETRNGTSENEVGKDRRADPDVSSNREREAQSKKSPQREVVGQKEQFDTLSLDAPSRSRRRDKGTAGKAYFSKPKDGNRRAYWIFG